MQRSKLIPIFSRRASRERRRTSPLSTPSTSRTSCSVRVPNIANCQLEATDANWDRSVKMSYITRRALSTLIPPKVCRQTHQLSHQADLYHSDCLSIGKTYPPRYLPRPQFEVSIHPRAQNRSKMRSTEEGCGVANKDDRALALPQMLFACRRSSLSTRSCHAVQPRQRSRAVSSRGTRTSTSSAATSRLHVRIPGMDMTGNGGLM